MTKRAYLFGSLLMIIAALIGCDSVESGGEIDDSDSDYEILEDELEGSLTGAGEVVPNLTPAAGNSPQAKLINRCIDVWNNMKVTKYVHSKDSVIDEQKGIYKYDCSGFVGIIAIKKVLPGHYRDLVDHLTSIMKTNGTRKKPSRPLAASFYDYFRDVILVNPDNISAENKYWKVFTSIDSLQRGDIIAARYDDNWRIDTKNPTTGHVMIAWDVGKVNSDNSVLIQVMDAVSSAHTKTADTRTMNSKPIAEALNGNKSGIGFGKMKYLISENAHKRPYAYKWSLNSKYWYNLTSGDNISAPDSDKYDRLKGIIFARPK
ncbi:hypothetical protein ACSSWA_06360 [Melioribacter sp. Ez-97]|uniref:hypothetical protein n=1 Tax=Melioribacter sp. Ez-97 TaxID=3423434 RepID=UPI003EDAB1B9